MLGELVGLLLVGAFVVYVLPIILLVILGVLGAELVVKSCGGD